jgi:hypothetical protein
MNDDEKQDNRTDAEKEQDRVECLRKWFVPGYSAVIDQAYYEQNCTYPTFCGHVIFKNSYGGDTSQCRPVSNRSLFYYFKSKPDNRLTMMDVKLAVARDIVHDDINGSILDPKIAEEFVNTIQRNIIIEQSLVDVYNDQQKYECHECGKMLGNAGWFVDMSDKNKLGPATVTCLWCAWRKIKDGTLIVEKDKYAH